MELVEPETELGLEKKLIQRGGNANLINAASSLQLVALVRNRGSQWIFTTVAISSAFIFCFPPQVVYGKQSNSKKSVRMIGCTKNLPVGSVITDDLLKIISVNREDRPADAVYDPWIAIGRRALKPLKKGQIMNFSQIFPNDLLTAPNRALILKMQGDYSLIAQDPDRDLNALVPVLRASRNVKAGKSISARDFVVVKVKENNCPADAVGDLWVVVGREAIHSIRAHENVYFHDIIPAAQWRQWLKGCRVLPSTESAK